MTIRRSVTVLALLSTAGLAQAQQPKTASTDPDRTTRPTATKRERIEAAIASLRARAVLPAAGEIGETGDWLAPAIEAVSFDADGVSDFGASLDVALVFADSSTNATAVSNVILPDPRIVSVTAINTTTVTPSAAELSAFDAVLVWTNSTPINTATLGDALADYVDTGGGCVLTMFGMRAGTNARTIGGRFRADNYYCIQESIGGSVTGAASLGSMVEPSSELIDGVLSFNGGSSSFRTSASLNPTAVRVANWSTGEPLIAHRNDLAGGRVDLGFFAVPAPASPSSWDSSTGGGMILCNALSVASHQATAQTLLAQGAAVAGQVYRNSNTAGTSTFSDQQAADDFVLPQGGVVSELDLWAVYTNNLILPEPPPPLQDFTVRIFGDNAGVPGALLYQTGGMTVSFRDTGVDSSPGPAERRIYKYRVSLAAPFLAQPGVKYWLSPLGNTAGKTWAWHSTNAPGTCAQRNGDAGAWSSSSIGGQLAFSLLADNFSFGGSAETVTNSNVTRGNVITVNQSQILDSFNMELEFSGLVTLYQYVMESNSPSGPWTPIFTDHADALGGGRFFYGTGPMNLLLQPGKYYYVAFGWNGSSVNFFRQNGTYPSGWPLGTQFGLAGQNSASNPVAGSQTIIGPTSAAEYSMRMSFTIAGCQANCDGSTSAPVLNVADFICFNNAYAAALGQPSSQQVASYANCDNSTAVPVLNVVDFICFNNKFAAGCP